MTLFDVGPPDPTAPPEPQLSPDQRRTLRNHAALATGRHPLMGTELDPDPEHTCGTCTHHIIRSLGKDYHKCELRETGGPATDVRVSWPGCSRWKPA